MEAVNIRTSIGDAKIKAGTTMTSRRLDGHIPECQLIEGLFSAKTADIDDIHNIYDRCGQNACDPEKRRVLSHGQQDGKDRQIRPYGEKDWIPFFHFIILLCVKIEYFGLRPRKAAKRRYALPITEGFSLFFYINIPARDRKEIICNFAVKIRSI